MIRSYFKQTGSKKEPKTEQRWEFSVRFIDEDGQTRQKHIKDFKTKKECKEARDAFLLSMSKNTKREGYNFEFLFNEYKKTWEDHSPSTIRVNNYWFDRFILPYFKNYLVTQIKMQDNINDGADHRGKEEIVFGVQHLCLSFPYTNNILYSLKNVNRKPNIL